MKTSSIASEIKFVNRIGATLSVEERIAIETQGLKLSHEYQYEQWNFWGRIEGIHKHYYIVEGVNFKGNTNFPTHKYFWAYQSINTAMIILNSHNCQLQDSNLSPSFKPTMISSQDNMKKS